MVDMGRGIPHFLQADRMEKLKKLHWGQFQLELFLCWG